MAYQLTYKAKFANRLNEKIYIEIYKKSDTSPDQVYDLTITYCNKKFTNGQGDKYDPIISSELNFGVFIDVNNPVNFDDILVTFTDEWKIILNNDGVIDFVGWLVPNECKAAMRDKPYDLEFTATDGLGYLRDISLTDINGNNFNNVSTLIEYVQGALKKTLLDLNTRIYCNIYESSMRDRYGHIQYDMFSQAKLDYRTFQDSPTEFIKCYDALLKILSGFTLYQYNGVWLIFRVAEMQKGIGPVNYYTDYTVNGAIIGGVLEDYKPAQVAKEQVIHPINADQTILSRFPIKSVKTSFDYTPWDEIPLNNKFERGSLRTIQTNPGPPITYEKKWNIDDWQYRVSNPFTGAFGDTAYKRTIENEFNVETYREVVLERNSGGSGHRFLTCSKIPVTVNDRVKLDYDFMSSVGGGGNVSHLFVTLETLDGSPFPWKLISAGGSVPPDGIGNLTWKQTQAINFLNKFYGTGEDPNNFTSFSFTTPGFPISGYLYICMVSFDPPIGQYTKYKNFNLEYIPRLGGMNVTGDYWFTSQNTNYRDIIEETIGISDCAIKVIKGTIFQNDGVTPTGKTWHRLFVSENLEYKEIVNIGRYNLAYRRTWEVTGSFGGTMFHPSNNLPVRLPLGFHRQFYFPNRANLNGYYFQLVPPLSIDYLQGGIDATFVDCLHDGANDGNQFGDNHYFKFIFKNG